MCIETLRVERVFIFRPSDENFFTTKISPSTVIYICGLLAASDCPWDGSSWRSIMNFISMPIFGSCYFDFYNFGMHL